VNPFSQNRENGFFLLGSSDTITSASPKAKKESFLREAMKINKDFHLSFGFGTSSIILAQ